VDNNGKKTGEIIAATGFINLASIPDTNGVYYRLNVDNGDDGLAYTLLKEQNGKLPDLLDINHPGYYKAMNTMEKVLANVIV